MIRRLVPVALLLLLSAGTARAAYQALDSIAAVVDDQIILASEVQRELAFQVLQRGGDPNRLSAQQVEEYSKQTLELLIRSRILVYKAKKDTIKIDEDQVESAVRQQMQEAKEENPNFYELLKAQNTTERDLRERYRKQYREQMLTQQVQQKLAADVDVSYREVQGFLQTYRDSLPPQFGVSHILIAVKAGDIQRAEARKKIDDLLARVRAGEDFAALAREHSEDTGSARDGGDLGYFHKGKMVPEFENAAFALKAGEVSDVVESSFGFHIIRSEVASPDSVQARHILILLRASEEDSARAYKLAGEIKERAQKGEKFADLVKQYSDDKRTVESGGFLGVWQRESPPPGFASALAGMRLGEVGGPVKTEYGWHVIKISEDRETVEGLIRQRKLTEMFEKVIEETRQKMYVNVRMKL